LKIYVYGYLNRVQSSRRLEQECQRNIELVWLTGRLTPDFKTIADFSKDNGAAETSSNVVEVAGQESAGEVQRERLAEIEFSLVRYLEEFLAAADVIRQFVQVIGEFGTPIDLARLLARKGLMLAPAALAQTNSKASSMSFKLTAHGDPPRCPT
jgi:hypothetical protein